MKNPVAFYCSSTSLGGLELNVARLAFWIKEAGIPVIFGGSEHSPLLKRIESQGIPCFSFSQNRNYYDWPAAYNVLNWMKKNGSKILFVHDTRDISIAASIKIFSGYQIKTLYQQQMQIGVNKRDLLHTLRYSQLDAWITPLYKLKDQIIERTRYQADKIYLAPLGVDPAALEVPESKVECREYFKLPTTAFVLGILGRIDDGKGQDFLIEVVHRMKEAGKELHLLIVGEPTLNKNDGYPEKLDSMIADFGLHDLVHQFPFMERTGMFFKAIDAFAMASVGETYGMVTVEAMISGVPVIGTNTGGTPELLDNGKCGMLYTPGNHAEFMAALEKLMASTAFSNSLAQSAQQRALTRYTRDVQVREVIKVLEKLE